MAFSATFMSISMGNYLFMAPFCVQYTRWLGSLYDPQATNMSAPEDGEFSHRVLPVFFWSPGSHK